MFIKNGWIMTRERRNMKKNSGKIFEDQLKASIPDYALLYKIPDVSRKYGESSEKIARNNLKACKNPFDFILWNSKTRVLFALECKTVKGKSIAFEREGDKECKGIHWHQIKGLTKWSEYDGICAGFIIEFREIETTIFLNIKEFNKLIDLNDKKSFNIKDLESAGIKYIIIPQKLKRIRYTYDIEELLNGGE